MAGKGGKRQGAGRKKGVHNKLTRNVKEAILQAFNDEGGVDYLRMVAKKDFKTFCTLLAGATIKVRSDAANRGATLAKRIITEVEVGLLVRAARTRRDRIMIEVTYAGGLRVSELVALTWSDVLPRDERVQLNIVGKGGKVRQVLLPEVVSRSLLSLRGDAGANDPVFASRKGGGHLNERAVNGTLKRAQLRQFTFADARQPVCLGVRKGQPGTQGPRRRPADVRRRSRQSRA
jgi:integrase